MSATARGVRQTHTPGDALRQTHPIGKGVSSADSLEVHLPSWLTNDERQAILEEVHRFVADAVEAVRQTHTLGAGVES